MGNKLSNSTGESCARKKIAILERKEEFPGKLRPVIEKFKENEPEPFLRKLERKFLDLLCENYYGVISETKGLNSDRDTEAEVELAIRFFPNVLSKRDRYGKSIIYRQLKSWKGEFNLKAVSFIPVLAELGIEFDQFEEDERGGLISGGWNVLTDLAANCDDQRKRYDEQHQRLVDEKFLTIMKRLRQKGLLKKEDIRESYLIGTICCQSVFPEQRFQYLVDWDPNSLRIPDGDYDDDLPIHCATHPCYNCTYIHRFQTIFEAGMRHFPAEIGLLFHKNRYDNTPYQMACQKFGNEKVKQIIDDVLNIQENDIDTINSLIYAATNDGIRFGCFDGVYFLLRREPSVLQTAVHAGRNRDTR